MDRATFEAGNVDPSARFATNTSRDVSEEDMRDFAQDISDTFLTAADTVSAGLLSVVYPVIDWNLTGGGTKTVTILLSDVYTIRGVQATIRADVGATVKQLFVSPYYDDADIIFWTSAVTDFAGTKTIVLKVLTGSYLDTSGDFVDTGGYVRGYVTVFYE